MKELKDHSLVTQMPSAVSGLTSQGQSPSASPSASRSDRNENGWASGDLEILADQLAQIVEELRRSNGNGSASSDEPSPAALVSSRCGTDRTATYDSRGELATGLAHSDSGSLASPSRNSSGQYDNGEDQRAQYLRRARSFYTMRRRRAAIFGNPELFGEPAWDILLDLYIAHGERKPVSVSSACIGSAAPPTTGLRWLGVLTEHDLILREHDPNDQRRVLVRLTEKGLQAMDEFFAMALNN